MQIPTGYPNMPDKVWQAKRIKHTIGLKADLGDIQEEFDHKEGYYHQQQGSPLWQPLQEAPGSSGSSKASGRPTSPQLAARCLEPQLQVQEEQKEDKQEEQQQEEDDDEQPVTAVPEAISTTVLTALTTPGLKRSYNKSQAQPQATPTDILQAMHMSLL